MKWFQAVKEKTNSFVQQVKETTASVKVGALSVMSAIALAVVPVSASAATDNSGAIDFSTIGGLDVSPVDVVSTGFSFANLFGSYTKLVLGAMFSVTAVGFIIWLWRKLPKFSGGKA